MKDLVAESGSQLVESWLNSYSVSGASLIATVALLLINLKMFPTIPVAYDPHIS